MWKIFFAREASDISSGHTNKSTSQEILRLRTYVGHGGGDEGIAFKNNYM